jgi:four helix bundle protein
MLNELPNDAIGKKVADQLIRCTMSVGANYEEARGADRRADFCRKLQIAFKEMREARYWILLIARAKLMEAERLDSLADEATQLRAILAKAIATARGKAKPANMAQDSSNTPS